VECTAPDDQDAVHPPVCPSLVVFSPDPPRPASDEECTYRYLAAAHAWASTETAAITRIGAASAPDPAGSDPPDPSARELRARPAPTASACLTAADCDPRS